MRIPRSFTLIALALLSPSVAPAVPLGINYQSQLLDISGNPRTGSVNVELAIWSASTGGSQLYRERHNGTPLVNGVFNLLIGTGTVLAGSFDATTFAESDRFLEVTIDGQALSPRRRFASVAYSLQAQECAFAANLDVRDSQDRTRAAALVLQSGAGFVSTIGANGNDNVRISTAGGNPNHGAISVHGADGGERGFMAVLGNGAGSLSTRGANGADLARMSSTSTNANHGFMAVYDSTGQPRAGFFVNDAGQGQMFADVKNFVATHPTKPDTRIVYTSLEGPEAGIYHRGVVRLKAGRAEIRLPEHFVALANEDSITVQLTAGSLRSKGLGFERQGRDRIAVGELSEGKGSYDVHFLVHALRSGYEGRTPVVSAGELEAQLAGAPRPVSTLP